MPKFAGLSLCLMSLACAGLKATPLTVDGKEDSTQEKGIRYFLPRPYLLVAELPQSEAKPSGDPKKDEANLNGGAKSPDKGGDGTGKDKGGNPSDQPATDSKVSADSSSGAASDTSFLAQSATYVMKLVYLPDYRHPVALSSSSGMFGSIDFKPTLQDGWMLTGFDANADNKVAETLTAVGSIVSGLAGGGSKASGGSGGGKLTMRLPSGNILRPGLYAFDWDEKTGALKGLHPVVFFSELGLVAGSASSGPPK